MSTMEAGALTVLKASCWAGLRQDRFSNIFASSFSSAFAF